jgi:hypothetical protein
MSLSKQQQEFVRKVADLIQFATSKGYGLTFGDAYRSQEQANKNAAMGIGVSNSLHCKRLAIDFNLFKDGKYLTGTEQYKELGEYWESIGGVWGGRFKRGDGNHFEWKEEV